MALSDALHASVSTGANSGLSEPRRTKRSGQRAWAAWPASSPPSSRPGTLPGNGLHTWPGQGSLFLDLEGTWVFSTTVKCMIPADTFLFLPHKLLVGNAVVCERWAPTFLETTVFAIRVSRVCSLRCVSVNRAASITLEATCWPLRGQQTTRSANGVCVLGHCSPRGCLGRD